MTPASEIRMRRLYKEVVGYDPKENGDYDWTPEETLENLQWFRTALIMSPDDPASYNGPVLTSAQCKKEAAQ